jgi:hypothetical protein
MSLARGAIATATLADALQESERRLRVLMETSIQAKVVHRRFRPLFVNAAFAEMFGFRDHEDALARETIVDLLDDDVRHNPDLAWTRLLGAVVQRQRRTLHRRDGSTFRAEVLARMASWDGEESCVMAIIDVTREERASRELKDAQIVAEAAARAKTRFLSAASHELRTPLHAAMGRLQLMQNEKLSPVAAQLSDEALAGCRRLLHHIDDVLDSAALESGSLPLMRESFDLGGAIEAVVAAARAEAEEIGVCVETDVADLAGDRLVGDERRVRRIGLALVEEALRRRPHNAVRLEAQADARGLTLAVSAPGAHAQPTLCSPSENAVEGMAIARALAGAMGGMLIERTSSKAAWEASAFLPLERQAFREPETDIDAGARDILVVEDNPGNRKLIERVLAALGHNAHIVCDGMQAIAAVASRPYDLVLMDLSMPGVDGLEATRRIRALSAPWAKLPIAALTASCGPGVQEAAAEAGMDAFLQKPVEVAKLAEAILLLTASSSVRPAELDHIQHEKHQNEAGDHGESSHR